MQSKKDSIKKSKKATAKKDTKDGRQKDKKKEPIDVGVTININNCPINIYIIDSLIMEIKKKKEFSSLDEPLIFHEVIKSIQKSSKTSKIFSEKSLEKITRSSNYKRVVKEVRRTLHRLYGMYQMKDQKHRNDLLEELREELDKKRPRKKDILQKHDALLKTHSSTEERIGTYPELYKKIFRITKKPQSILDIGCGLNPVSLPYMNLKGIKYTVTDISLGELDFLKDYFSLVKKRYDIRYKTKIINLLRAKKENVFKGMRKHDVAFLFKVLEIIELSNSHKISEKLIKSIPAKWIVVSFPTKTLTKKLMNYVRRGWLHMMLERLGYEYHLVKEKNEIFFIIKK